jgi:hypothetical protein
MPTVASTLERPIATRRTSQAAAGRGVLTATQAAQLCGLTEEEFLGQYRQRRDAREGGGRGVPAAVSTDDGSLVWRAHEIRMWALRTGRYQSSQGGLISLLEVAQLIGRSPHEVRDLLAQRETAVADDGRERASDIPEPAGQVDGLPAWAEKRFKLWALRMGIYGPGLDGEPVIGYTGIAQMLNLEEQSVRALMMQRAARVRDQGSADPLDIPEPYGVPDRGAIIVPLWPIEAIRRWAMQTGRLSPDGTPLQLRPRRGKSRAQHDT